MAKMWDMFFARRQFYDKCKSAVKMIDARMEIIMNKRNAMQKFLKNDVADLLRSNLDRNAYGRAKGLYMELNLTWCYNYVKECCALVADKLKVMQTESECPEECRVAVASLAYAAARFADLPELRDLRSLFSEKYGNALDPFVNKELVEKLKSNPPTMEATVRLMKDIAKEFSIAWDPASLEQNQDRSTKDYKSYNTVSEDIGLARNDSTRRQGVAYEHTPSMNASGYKEVGPRRPFASNIVPAPYVILKDQDGSSARFTGRLGNREAKDENGGARDENSDEEDVMNRLRRHYSMKSWMKTRDDRTEGSRGSNNPSGVYGRSVSMYVHPKLPDCDELASRIEALRKM